MPKLAKAVFDFYFRDDLYGHWIERDPIVLSSGSFDETVFGLPESLKACIRFALRRNWYGYSDSLGRMSAREALAALETERSAGRLRIEPEQVAVTLGGTAAVASIAELLADTGGTGRQHALCGIPNYPPLVAALGRRMTVDFVHTPTVDRATDIEELTRSAAEGRARVILLQTVTNPTGLRVPEEQLAALVAALPSDCFLILDECHDSFGPGVELTPARLAPNVISVRSMSKRWAAPGLKAGWMVASTDFIDAFYTHASTTYGGPPSIFYLLLEMFGWFEAALLRGELDTDGVLGRLSSDYGLSRAALKAGFAEYVEAHEVMAVQVQDRRRYALDAFRSLGLPCLAPEYSINMMVRIGDEPSYATYRRLVSEAGVSVYPTLLNLTGGPGLVRVSPNLPEPALAEAVNRLARWTEYTRA
ncbi:pyridoxal phosphate-dependent aminotransferase [Streptomyces sp. 4N509B]|uniref:pyridoxal phosphate-dependent aminotransferase n=1 Tax=Streptomyces sp. 4N509B TaxID=3457413 RepID=UPI003FCF7471